MNQRTFEEEVYKKRPIFGEIVKKYGDLSFVDYLDSSLPKNLEIDVKRKKEFLKYFESFLKDWVNPVEVEPIINSFSQTWTVCTADHHGVPWHPFFVNENLAHARLMHNRGVEYACVFTASGVSLGNSSLPRSIGFHDNEKILQHLHLFPASMRMHPVHGMKNSILENTLDLKEVEVLDEIFKSHELKESKNFSHQITKITQKLWEYIPSDQFSRLAFLPIEDIVSHIFINLEDSHPLWRLLVEQTNQYLDSVLNIQGAHSHDMSHGSMIFWHVNEKGLREQLIFKNGRLENIDNDWSVLVTVDILKDLLKKQEIYPTYALCLMVISCYFGITCMGGFSQVGYLKEIHEAYDKLVKNFNLPILLSNSPSIFCGECVVGTIFVNNQEVPATLIDIINKNEYLSIIDKLEKTPLKDLIKPMIPDLYKIIS